MEESDDFLAGLDPLPDFEVCAKQCAKKLFQPFKTEDDSGIARETGFVNPFEENSSGADDDDSENSEESDRSTDFFTPPETQSDGSLDSDEHETTKARDKNEKLLAGKM